MSKKIAALDFGKFNKVYEVINSRTDDQIIKGFDLVRSLNGQIWNNLPEDVELMHEEDQDKWVYEKYPLAQDIMLAVDMYFQIAQSRFPVAFHKFFWDFSQKQNQSLREYL